MSVGRLWLDLEGKKDKAMRKCVEGNCNGFLCFSFGRGFSNPRNLPRQLHVYFLLDVRI